jgi:hypothetical protein
MLGAPKTKALHSNAATFLQSADYSLAKTKPW